MMDNPIYYSPRYKIQWIPNCRRCKHGEGFEGLDCQVWKNEGRLNQGYNERGEIICNNFEEDKDGTRKSRAVLR